MKIPFSPPDISEIEISNVIEVLKSGWITTGVKTKEYETKIAEYCGTECAVCLNSATACLELILRVFGVGAGDEVITSSYTYTASASVIDHVGAKIVLVDTAPDSYEMDYDMLENVITEKTKAIIPVDVAGVMCDYDKIFDIINRKKHLFSPETPYQKALGRILVMADAAHSFGASYKDIPSGNVADFTAFSFHAVKNLTTAEGGALTWRALPGIGSQEIYDTFKRMSLHGQSEDAYAKSMPGAWEYDIVSLAYKCNMTDIAASIGLGQLERYPKMQKRRKELVDLYMKHLPLDKITVIRHENANQSSSRHLLMTRLNGKNMEQRNAFIQKMAEMGVACNVHYKPLPMHTAYQNLGFDIKDFPNAKKMFENEVTFPLYSTMRDEDVIYICDCVKKVIEILKR
ncbi:MAG: DegT/DnrJ/EryC1/StrS aminotransferase family protein [Clostridia bacterium]|nr:DegT/DnrJ/EryC1/StrS aminotransferase family protein [Clostridia bacterium]